MDNNRECAYASGQDSISVRRYFRVPIFLMLIAALAFWDCSRDWKNPVDNKNGQPNYLPTEGLVAWYPFNGNANDESGNGRNGTIFGARLTDDRMGNEQQAYQFDGVDDYIDVGNWELGGEISICGWLYYQAINRWARFIDFGNGENTQNLVISNYSTSNTLAFHIYRSSDSVAKLEFNQYIDLDKWIFICATAASTGEMRLYRDGTLLQTAYDGFTPEVTTRTQQYIAKSNWVVDGYFKGMVDDIRIYDRVLSDAEIETLYHENGFYHPLKTPEIKAWGISDSSIKIQWSSVAKAGTYLLEYASIKVGPYSQLSSGTDTSYTHSGLTKNQTVWYRVQARNDHTSSTWSDTVTASAVAIPVDGLVAFYLFYHSIDEFVRHNLLLFRWMDWSHFTL